MELFAITCTTCQARLKVRDIAAIGKILACPKCQSMVQVAPPPGWRPPEPAPVQAAPAASPLPSVASVAVPAPAITDSVGSGFTIKIPQPIRGQPGGPRAIAETGGHTSIARTPAREPVATTVAVPVADINPDDIPPLPPAEVSEALLSRFVASVSQQRLLLACSPIAALALALLAWLLFRPTDVTTDVASLAAHSATTASDVDTRESPAELSSNVAANAAPPSVDATATESALPAVADAPPEGGDQAPAEGVPEETASLPSTDGSSESTAVTGAPPNAIAEPESETPAGVIESEQPAQSIVGNVARPLPPHIAGGASTSDSKVSPLGDNDDADPDHPAATGSAEAADRQAGLFVAQETMPQIDVAARLADSLPGVQFKRVPLADFCDFLSRLSTVPITLDVDALAAAGVRVNDPVSVSAADTTVGAALDAGISKYGLVHVIEGQQLIITSTAGQSDALTTARYDVHDLAPEGREETDRLALQVARYVAPATWHDRGGKAHVESADGELIVEQTPLAQRSVTAFLDKLRQARGLVAKGTSRQEDAALKTRYGRAKATLDKVVTANFAIETPMADVLAWLGRSTGARILIDEASLWETGSWPRIPATVVADHQPLHEVLTALLGPAGMTYRVVDERTIQVFAIRAAAERYEFEVYPVRDLLAGRLDSKELLARLREQFDPATWTEGGGSGAIDIDASGKFLLVLQSPEAQVRLENLLVRAQSGKRKTP